MLRMATLFFLVGCSAVPALGSELEVAARIEQAMFGQHRSEAYVARNRYRHPVGTLTFFGLDDGMTTMARYTNMSAAVKKVAEETEAAIRAGKLTVFKCPVVNQDGETVPCKGGDQLGPGQIRGMNWFVKGVDTKMPGK